jgi:spore germination protein (amino acid permease)
MAMSEKLGFFHIIVLTYMIQSGVVLFRLASMLAEYFGSNGWLMVPVFSVVALFNIYLIGLVYKYGKGKSIFEIHEKILPKPLLYPIYMFLAIVWATLGCLVSKQYVLIFQMIAFPTTNPLLFKAALDMLIFLLLIKGLYNITKAATVIFFLTIWMLTTNFYFLPELELARYTSFLFYQRGEMVKGAFETFTAFLGYELAILFFPYVDKSSKLIRGVMYGNIITSIVYLTVTVVSFGFFSYQQLTRMMLPMLDLLAYIKLPFIERMENLLFAFFYLKVLVTSVLFIWAAQQTLMRIFKRTKEKALGFIIVVLGYIAVSFLTTLEEVNTWLTLFSNIEIGIAFGLPIVCLLLIFLAKGKERRQKESAKK